MIPLHPQYIVDESHARRSIILPLGEWEKVLDDLEELDDIRDYDAAMTEPGEPLSFEQVAREIREQYGA
ncbi:MAG: hypothetical protein JNK74_01765 [Candidatus Hydrogenedentes bacterium]|nr:hypothetical protein [Candidatus Hydrogenedentota bacterium]